MLTRFRIVDLDRSKAVTLMQVLQSTRPGLDISVIDNSNDLQAAVADATGLINCTPLGMEGYGGTSLPREFMHSASWAFDVVYTPLDTQFLQDAAAAGLEIMSGWELFFYQGVNAFEIFCGQQVDEDKLRQELTARQTVE